ncbi:MAG: lipopolysaccharide biosynthesis protein [Bacteroidota bacterium]
MSVSNLKRKTVNGFFWSMLESVLSQGQGMVFGIFLARMLSPQEFGLLGMITIFISIAQVFVDSGLNQALVRKQQCTNLDYSTIFWVNIVIGFVAFIVIWFAAPLIATFYQKPELILLTRVTSIAILIGSVTLIQQTILTKDIDFKTLTKTSTTGTFISGVASLVLAFYGFGVWSLVWRTLINQAVRSYMMWRHNRWLPQWVFSKRIFSELFSFGSKILFISVIAAVYKSFYNLIIGKNYSDTMLGYYTNADQYSTLPSSTISNVTNKVSYPILSEMQDDNVRLKSSISKLIKNVMYLSFIIMFGLAAVAQPLFSVLFGPKWLPSVPIFQALCLAYAISPMHVINHNIMKVKGRSDLFLRTEIIKYIVFTPLLFLGIIYGLKVLVAGIVLFYWLGFFINALYAKQLIGYSIKAQFTDFLPVMILFAIPALLVWGLGFLIHTGAFPLLILQSACFILISLAVSILFKIRAFFEIKEILLGKFTINNFIKTINKS